MVSRPQFMIETSAPMGAASITVATGAVVPPRERCRRAHNRGMTGSDAVRVDPDRLDAAAAGLAGVAAALAAAAGGGPRPEPADGFGFATPEVAAGLAVHWAAALDADAATARHAAAALAAAAEGWRDTDAAAAAAFAPDPTTPRAD